MTKTSQIHKLVKDSDKKGKTQYKQIRTKYLLKHLMLQFQSAVKQIETGLL